jgi:hypothetical protein
MLRIRFYVLISIMLVWSVSAVVAQSSCPATILLAVSRANTACIDLAPEAVCWGNGTVETTFYDGSILEEIGTTGDSQQLARLQTHADADNYGIASLTFQANLARREPGRFVKAFLFGEVELTNDIPPVPTVSLTAIGQVKLRILPDATEDIIETFPLRTTLTANGLWEAGGWYRVLVPNSDQLAWVSEEVIQVVGDANTLHVVSVDDVPQRPFERITLRTASDDAACDGAPQSGLLLQTPNPEQNDVRLVINEVEISLRGAAFIQADTDLTIYVLDGQAWVNQGGVEELIPAGTYTVIDGSPTPAEPYTMETFAGLPINSLAYRFAIASPRSQEEIAAYIQQALLTPTPPPTREEQEATFCRRTVTRPTTIWAGPSNTYEALGDLPTDAHVSPVLRVVFSSGETWWQLRAGGWIPVAHTQSSDICGEVPITETIPPPRYNTLILETCKFTNGPVRAGQQVYIEFTVGGWDTYEEAHTAPQVDPGRMVINSETYRTRVTNPFEAAPERWYLHFYHNWQTESGTYRIVGEHLTYSVSCDVTVPVG